MSAVSRPKGPAACPCPTLREAIAERSSPILETISTTFLGDFAEVNAGRRATIRSATLLAANRASCQPTPASTAKTVSAWSDALKVIGDFVDLITPDIMRELDELVAGIDDPTNPAGETLRTAAIKGMGFSPAEYEWCLTELDRAGYRILFALSDGDPKVLAAMVEAAASGDNGVLQIGFLSLSSSEAANARVRGIVSRSRPSGITASIFHFLPAMILSAAALGDEALPLRILMNDAGRFGKLFGR